MTDVVQCTTCPRGCWLRPDQVGLCGARVARGGEVICENYGRVTSLALDPIEKKPLACYKPGSQILSVGSYGCNLHCPFCQNASIACARAADVPWRLVAPEELIATAASLRERGNVGVAFTYNEPLISWEYVRDVGDLAHRAGLVNVLVTNGMASAEVVEELAPVVDAANIDLKAFTPEFYDWVGGDLDTVKHTIETLVATPTCHVEVTTLIIPGKNDTPGEIEAAARWLASLDPDLPYHVTRFFPCHRLADRPATPVKTVYDLAEVARRHLNRVFAGNC